MLFKVVSYIYSCTQGTCKILLRGFIGASIFILCVSGLHFAPGVITQLNFNEGTGTVASDISGNGHNGTLVNGPVWVAGKYDQGISLDGTNDYVNIADHPNYTLTPTQSYSWSGWVRNNNFNEWNTVWSQTLNSTNFFYFYAHTTADVEAGPVTNGLSVYWYSGASNLILHSNNNVLTVGQWSYVAVTYDASQAQANRFTIYVNGVDVTDRSDVVSAGTISAIDPTDIRIGSNQPFGEYLNGSVDEVRYYRRLISVAEMQSDMNMSDTQVPAVNITAPSAGNVSGTINVTANASDNVGVSGVQFLLDGVNLGTEDISSPYSVSWLTTGVANGNHTLTARARDAAGNTTTSTGVIVTVNNDLVSPAVNITAPTAGTITGTVNVNATATDNVGVAGVQFLLNGTDLGTEDITAPYSFSWNTVPVANGTYTLTARARDAAGNTTTSAGVIVTVNNDHTLPAVILTAPAAGIIAGTININANASDNVGVVGVQFLLDGNNLGTEDITAPYSFSWNTLTVVNGTYTLTARARDAAGNTTTSAGIIVSVDNESPVVSITAPVAGTVAGTININANASDNVAVTGVQFLLNGADLGTEDITAPFSFSWNTLPVINGTYTLSARARDAAGNIATSAGVIVTVDNDYVSPAVSITAPAAGNVSGTININANASDNVGVVGVQFLLNGVDLGTEDITAPYSFSWNTLTVANGTYTLTARARDAAGNTTASAGVIVTVDNDYVSPAVSITAPAPGNASGTININANASDNVGVVGVQFLLNGADLGTEDITAPYSFSWNTLTVANGTYTLTARARDAAGNIATSAGVIVTVDNDYISPTVSITAPAAGTIAGTININANASDIIGVVGVQFLLDGNNLGTEDATAPWSISWNTLAVANGTYTVTARARDAAGNTATSASVVVTVDNDYVSPTVTITAPAAGNVSGTTNINAIASDNVAVAGVQFLLNGSDLGAEDIAAPYSFSWNTLTVTNGSYTLTARARDAAGNTVTSAGIIVMVDNDPVPPIVNITAPAGGIITGTVNINANASDNVGVVGVQFLLDGNNLGTEDITASYSLSWNTLPVANGTYNLTARARDAAGNTATSAVVVVTVDNDLTSPTINITAPATGNVSGTININANAADNVSVMGVQFFLNGADLGTEDITAPYSLSWNTLTVANGTYTLTARARDAAGNTATSAGVIVTVFNDLVSPTVNITAPAAGNVSGTININANASDNVAVTGVQFLLNGSDLGTEDITAPYSLSWNTLTVANGTYTLTARARDAAGNTATSAGVIVTVNNDLISPAVNITAPATGNVTGTINVTANASDNAGVAGVQFLLNGANLGTEDLTAPYSVSWNTLTVANGSYTLTARARDAAGNTATSAGVIVTVNNDITPPVINIITPVAGNVSGTINVNATATDNVGVTGVQFLLDGNNLGAEDVTAPYSFSWNTLTTANGSHTLMARARDAAGNITTSATVAVTVNNPVNLIAALNFNEGTGTNAADISGNNHNGTLTSAAWLAGKYDQGLNFNGTASYVSIADHNNFTLNVAQNYTWSAWVRNTNFNQWGTVWSQTADASNYFYFYAHSTTDEEAGPVTNGISVYWFNGTNKVVIHSNNNVLTAATWSHIAVTYNGSLAQASRFTIYINGVDVTNRTDVVSMGTIAAVNPTNIRIASNQLFGDYLNAAIDEVRYYNRLLSAAEVQTDMNTPIGNDIAAPAVSISSPANGSTVTAIINVTANASDNIAVAGVQFLLDGADLGAEDLAAPYSVSWNSVSATSGNHILSARARDAAGNLTTSTTINVTVNNDFAAPVISITAPAAGTIAGTMNINADASDNIGVAGVQFLLNGANLGAEDIIAPWSFAWNTNSVTDGNYTLTARARDAAGNVTTSSPVIVNVLNHPPDTEFPTISVTSPIAGDVTGTVHISADANDNVGAAGVQFLLNGVNLGSEDLTAPYSFSWNTLAIANGNYTLTAKARDATGNITTSAGVIVNVNNQPDTEQPTISITAPAAGNVSGTISATANANDNMGVAGVQFLLDGNNLGAEDLTAPYSVSWNTTTLTNGIHTLTARARDAAGNTGTSTDVIVTIDNDVTAPTINITAPDAGNVSGTISITANANDNIAVAGVQFLLDGNPLGSENLTAPYSVSWNTGFATNGTHSLSARARDAAGNTTTAVNVNVIVTNSNPVISGVSVSSITPGSAVINWTTNVPTTSQVKYGATTTYGLSTLVNTTLMTSHSRVIDGLDPGMLYHYQVISADVNDILATTTDNTFTTAILSPTLGTLNGHTVDAFPAGKIIPWTTNPTLGYDSVMRLAWNYLLNTVPNDPSTGKPAYYSRSYINPTTQQMVDWPHNPAGLYGMLVESALKYYGYSGDANVMQLAINVALWQLDHGMTLTTDNWPGVPYSEGLAGSVNYSGASPADGAGNLEPDKIGELGHAWLELYKYNGNTRFRDAAIQAANVLSSKVRTGTVSQSPWPFRVKASNGVVIEDYCSNIIAPVSLLDGLIAAGIGDTATYRTARNIAWNWMMTYPMQNNVWTQYFEDVAIQSNYNSNLNQLNANMVARYLLEHPEFDANWETHVRGIITWVENVFGQTQFGSTIIKEQLQFAFAMGSHTSRYASVNALLYEKTGDLIAKEKAYRSFNWATYMCKPNGVVIDGPEVNNQWFTDGYGDYIRHFMTGMAAVPEWSPANQTHLLRSRSVVKNISYSTSTVNYTIYGGDVADVLHVNFNPVTVTVNGMALSKRSDLNQPGWTLDAATKTLKIYYPDIYHAATTQIIISAGTAPSAPVTANTLCPGGNTYLTMSNPGNDYTYQWQIDSTGRGFVDLLNDAVHDGTKTDILWLNPPTSYSGFKYRCIATNSTASVFGTPYALKFLVVWRGTVSAAWENTSNWTCNYVPDGFTDVVIPSVSANNPVISNNAAARSVTLSSGSHLTVSPGIKLDIKGK